MVDIKFCENNFGQGAEEVVNILEDEGIEYEVEQCLGYCGGCAIGPFALLDDDFIQADTPEELYKIIMEQI